MAHDTSATHAHDDHGHGDHGHNKAADRPNGATLTASYVVALLLAGLFIAAVNFIGVMSSGHGGHGDEKGPTRQQHEATSNQTLHGEGGLGADKEHR